MALSWKLAVVALLLICVPCFVAADGSIQPEDSTLPVERAWA